jgi:bacillithiol system protein YtxJ
MGKANFVELNSVEELETLIEASKDKPVVFFKHSVTCPISHGVYRIVDEVDADINLIVVQRARGVSNALAELTGIRHESPQAIVIDKRASVYTASHYDIEVKDIEENL